MSTARIYELALPYKQFARIAAKEKEAEVLGVRERERGAKVKQEVEEERASGT
jgi:hypothetical protein